MSTYITKRAEELGLKMVDAKEPLTIKVSQGRIDKSQAKNSRACAFARTCEETVPGCEAAFFFRSTAWLERDGKLIRYLLPPSVQKEIVAFDRNKTMEPGTYQLTAPGKSQTLAAVAKRSAKRPGRHQPGSGKIKRKIVHRTTNVRDLFDPSYRAAK